MLLPHLQGREDVQLAHVVTNKSLSAMNAQRKFGFAAAGTEVGELLDDETIDAVFVVTRHSSHAALTCRALEMGKAVFVEKPLALTLEEIDRILATIESSGNDRLMVGFNRRFAPLLVSMRDRFGPREPRSFVRYLVNAGPLAPDSWYANSELEGSRFLGEGGHFIDTVSWWLGSDPIEVSAVAGADPDEVHVTLRYDGGSLGTISYLTGGHPRFPKETIDINGAGRSARLDNFRKATVWTGRRGRSDRARPDKGQRLAIDSFLSSVRTGASMPIPLSSLVATTRASIAVGSSLVVGKTAYR
jgi:predicted dehydrogenase